MYLSFYNLAEKPFQISTDPRFLWLGEKHQEALANLRYGLLERNGYVVLTGDVGTGKTTLINALCESVDRGVLTAHINHPSLNAYEFLSLVAKQFDPSMTFTDKSDLLLFFNSFLNQAHADGRVVLLIIDEAHRLSTDLLEEIRLLSNIEVAGQKLINIFFVGQNELKPLLSSSQSRPLRQRITLFYDIHPLSEEETEDYVIHRLKVAGTQLRLFTRMAAREIYRYSKGYPRLINVLCDRALLTGFVRNRRLIDAGIITECVREMPLSSLAASSFGTSLYERISELRSSGIAAFQANSAVLTHGLMAIFTQAGVAAGTVAKRQGPPIRLWMQHSIKSAGALVKKNRRKLIPTGVLVLVGVISVALTIGAHSGANTKIQPSITAARDQNKDKSEPNEVRILPTVPREIEKSSKPVPVETPPALESNSAPGAEIDDPKENGQKADHLDSKALVNQAGLIMDTVPLEAESLLNKAVKMDPQNATAHFMLANLYRRNSDYPRAIDAYNRAVQLNSKFTDAFFNLGIVYSTYGKYAAAEASFARTVQLKPIYLDKALFNLAVMQHRLGKKQESLKHLERAVIINPNNPKVRDYLDRLKKPDQTDLFSEASR
jgi:type II secretory pathway predicted ATPase ExeA/TolA-binding protein